MTTARRQSSWASTALAGCALPEPPGDLGSQVRDLELLRAGTRPGAPALRGLGWFAVEAEEQRGLEYVLAGIEEVSANSHALHLIVSYGHLLVALQAPASLGDGIEIPLSTKDALAGVAELQELVIKVAAAGKLSEDGKLIVVDSAFGYRGWKWTGDAPADGGGGVGGAGAFLIGFD